MSNTRKPRGLREALAKRQTRELAYPLPVVPYEEAQQRQQRVTEASQTVTAGRYLHTRENSPETKKAVEQAEKALAKAEKERDECFHPIRLRGIPEEDFDLLVQMHPPTEEQLSKAARASEEPPLWNEETLLPALLEHCAQESELSAAEWDAELAGWTRGERRQILQLALDVNIRSYASALTFG